LSSRCSRTRSLIFNFRVLIPETWFEFVRDRSTFIKAVAASSARVHEGAIACRTTRAASLEVADAGLKTAPQRPQCNSPECRAYFSALNIPHRDIELRKSARRPCI
jgi:hypothetical protein